MSFAAPSLVPQDLLLIQDLVGVPELTAQKLLPKVEDGDIDSSDSSGSENENENGSEDEIQADLVSVEDEAVKAPIAGGSAPAESTSESDSSGSESDSEDDDPQQRAAKLKHNVTELDAEDDESGGVAAPTTSYFQTKNEVAETDIVVPDIEEIGSDEILERVGEIMSIIDKTVIVKGAPAELLARASDKALDCDTLLVFEDRKVLGYIYDTFGPTTQPMYQIKFSASYPLDKEKVQLSRPVYHVPQRSHFVFVNQIKRFKGSDASNMHDEEPADDELEFSDDEAEAAHKRQLKRKRGGSRANSVVSSRASTPSPALMRDQELSYLERNPYDDYSPYDDNFGMGSRPAPIPYDDPYSDEYNNVPVVEAEPSTPASTSASLLNVSTNSREESAGRGRGRGRGRGSGFDQGRGRGRGRDRDRDRRGRGNDRSSFKNRRGSGQQNSSSYNDDSHNPYPPPPRPLSPTSMAIARATGQLPDGSQFAPSPSQDSQWQQTFDPSHQFNAGYPPPFVQPHINPRFASAFGMNMQFQPPPQSYYHPPPPPQPQIPQTGQGGSWTDEWTVHNGGNDSNSNGA
ncbi:Gar1/Naf1 RNA binding region-domain-containing protein [Favolaschia claudopus]|uniref:H/ACA ribonucleoprotein complex non-core subunit NAF1 n=1 Tax=Favolaschia claudopus TaxID=2862362 RepID=A0AAW0EID7_9AGAR